MSGGRKTESFYGIKTREIVVQNADGTFPAVGTVLTIVDNKGHGVTFLISHHSNLCLQMLALLPCQ